MHYQISRNGQIYGPYTLEDLQRYLASGNVLATDLAKSEEMADWLPVAQILSGTKPTPAAAPVEPGFSNAPVAGAGYGGAEYGAPVYNPAGVQAAALADSPYPDAPNLHWGLVLLFSVLTCGMFMFIWNLVIASWLKRVQPNATSLFYYTGAAVLLVVRVLVAVPHKLHVAVEPGLHVRGESGMLILLGIALWVVRLIARYSQRASLEEHFNGPEPVGLQIDAVMTFFFGGLYFQSKLNEINAIKQAARYGAVRQF